MSKRKVSLQNKDISDSLHADDDSDFDSEEDYKEFQEIFHETFREIPLADLSEWEDPSHFIHHQDEVSIKAEIIPETFRESSLIDSSETQDSRYLTIHHDEIHIKAEIIPETLRESSLTDLSETQDSRHLTIHHDEMHVKAEIIDEKEDCVKELEPFEQTMLPPLKPLAARERCQYLQHEKNSETADNDMQDVPRAIHHGQSQSHGRGRSHEEREYGLPNTSPGSWLSANISSLRGIDAAKGWTYLPREEPVQQPVFESSTGVRAALNENSSPYECLSEFLTQDFWKLVKTETNRYAAQMKEKLLRKGELKEKSFLGRWKAVTHAELKQFFSIIIHMILVKKESLDSYWSTKSILHSTFAAKLMSRDRFRAIYSCLHLNDNTRYTARGNENYDALFKLRPYFDKLNRLFEAHYMPEENLTIDEGTCRYRGSTQFRVFNKNKPDKYCMKIYMLSDSATGYALRIIPYVIGSKTVQDIILGMIEPYLYKWHTVYMDQVFSSPAVFDLLWEKETRAVGTVMLHRRDLPQEWRHQPLQSNEMIFGHRDNLTACKWKDKHEVSVLSTKHAATWTEVEIKARGGKVKRIKPDCILDYNVNKCGVDVSDQYVRYYSLDRKSMKWWKKLFFHLFSRSMVNAYILYNKSRPQKRKGFAKFLVDCGEALAQEGGFEEQHQHTSGPNLSSSTTRLSGRHFVGKIRSSTDGKPRARACKVCSDTGKKLTGKRGRRETTYYCPDCDVPLCPDECFRKYHTLKDYTS